ncbi:hypothetical protein V7S43_013874 [Phytophthora oleae]|uniref:PiggyBac transposable element-derived protein 4 C-terminal zinc-ribbon domain-containing protein n=1 Tax=Phytophthora oleae TaxID=2107226 RepID=A0ABD3F415_9STRA
MYESNTFGTQPAPTATVELREPSSDATTHVVRQVERWRNQETQPKRYRQACKVCAILHTGKRAPTSKFFCGDCNGSGPIFLCKAARYKVRDVAMTSGIVNG